VPSTGPPRRRSGVRRSSAPKGEGSLDSREPRLPGRLSPSLVLVPRDVCRRSLTFGYDDETVGLVDDPLDIGCKMLRHDGGLPKIAPDHPVLGHRVGCSRARYREETVRKTITAIALAVVLGITGLGSTLSASAADQSVQTRARSCTPGYRPCIANRASDVDCYGGSGNGPRYTRAGVVYRVRGADRYGLDADNDGRGCE